MDVRVKVFWDEKYHMQWKCSVCRKELYELYNLYNENKGLICGGLMCGEILNSSCLDFFWNSLFEVVFYKRGIEVKNSPLFLWHNFNDFMVKEPCTKFCRVLIISHEVMKLQSFESGVSDVTPANLQNISALVFFAHFCEFHEKKSFCTVLWSFWPFLVNLLSCEVLND